MFSNRREALKYWHPTVTLFICMVRQICTLNVCVWYEKPVFANYGCVCTKEVGTTLNANEGFRESLQT